MKRLNNQQQALTVNDGCQFASSGTSSSLGIHTNKQRDKELIQHYVSAQTPVTDKETSMEGKLCLKCGIERVLIKY